MAAPTHTPLQQTVQNFWSLIYGEGAPKAPEVVTHDPSAERAHDLDDPFFDSKVQKRVGEVIGHAQRNK